jgi:hypothetical protein
MQSQQISLVDLQQKDIHTDNILQNEENDIDICCLRNFHKNKIINNNFNNNNVHSYNPEQVNET